MVGRSLRSALVAIALPIACIFNLILAPTASAQTPQLIVDLLTTPQKHWNTTVIVKGHVRTVTPNPPGTNRGTFVFRDSSDCDITVVTSELPSVGKEYTLVATVEQETPEATVPVLKEVSRRVGVSVGNAPSSDLAPTPKLVPSPKEAVAPPPTATPAPATPPTITAAPSPTPAASPAPAPGLFGMSTTMAYGVIAAVAVISLGLIFAFRPKPAAPAVELEPRVIVQGPRVPPLLPGAPPAPPAQDPADQATRFVAPKPVAASAATTVFVDLGADLMVTEGPDTGKKYPLTKPRITIGRRGARQNEIELSDQSVSREAAKIIFNPTDQTFNLINESVTNPTRVNGTAIESALLQPNDLIQLGATTIKFVRKNAGPTA